MFQTYVSLSRYTHICLNHLKHVLSPYVPPIDPLHPTPDEYLDKVRNLRTIDLIIR